ncbi:MAG: S8 family serine peptidase [Proteobacteria bacterium]|nr:S8 family serine peptidase [Pseudomonadota bacterium]
MRVSEVGFGAWAIGGDAWGPVEDTDSVAAMERALDDDMDVLNMSIGSTYQWPQYPTAQAATRLVNSGMVVVASAGNSGGTGMYSTGAPSVGEKVIAVASFDNTHVQQSLFTISPDDEPIGYNPASGSPSPPTSGSEPLARTGTASSTDDACAALPADSLDGYVALIRRGGCFFHTKALNAQNAGATGVVLYNNAAGGLNATVAGTPAITIPVVGISDVGGELIDARLAGGPVELTWTSQTGSFPNPSGGLISGFSSYGMSPDLQLKPDIGAPGGAIYSTYPLERGGYATISGTSMSSPHVAGAAALLLQSAPGTPSQAVGRILQNSAQPKPWSLAPGFGLLDHAHRQGAGMLRIDDAVTAATRIEPGKLSLGESEAGPSTYTLELENNGDAAVTYQLSSVNAISTGANTFSRTFNFSNASVAFGTDSLTLQAGASASVGVTITPATGPIGGQYGGYLVFTPDDGSATLRVPFAGYVGDYQARQVLAPTPNGFPWLAQLDGGSYFNRPDGATYSMVGNDIPFFLIHFDHQSRRVRMDVVDADSGKSWHRAFETEYFGRNSGANSFFAFSWDGVTTTGKTKAFVVPDGDYVVKLSVLKALGDDDNAAHWEQWESPVITIARP